LETILQAIFGLAIVLNQTFAILQCATPRVQIRIDELSKGGLVFAGAASIAE
jgi:hypothetical protein